MQKTVEQLPLTEMSYEVICNRLSALLHEPELKASGGLVALLALDAKQFQSPFAAFDAKFYLSHLPPELARTVNPLNHYLQIGYIAMLPPHPCFDMSFLNEKVLPAKLDGNAIKSPAIPALLKILESLESPYATPNILFEPELYVSSLPTDTLNGLAPFEHFLRFWPDFKVAFSRYFDVDFYALENKHILKAGLNPLVHYFSQPIDQRSDPNPMIHSKYYATMNPRVQGDPFVHYLRYGIQTGFMPNPYAEQELRTSLTDYTRSFHLQLIDNYISI